MNQHSFQYWYFLLFTVVTAIGITACTTTKKKGDLGALAKFYHNTTAQYNGYFNANILMEESIQKLNRQHEDNYNKLLPVYEYMAVPDANAVASDLDKAIEKVSVVVNLHRPSKWTDDCYLLFGKANFLKKDYETAEKGFSYLVDKYEPSKVKEREEKAEEQQSRKEALKERREKIREKQEARRELAKKIRKLRKKGKYDKIKKEREEFEKEYGEDDKDEEEKKKEDQEEEQKTQEQDNSGSQEVVGDFLNHRSTFQNGQLWLARTYIERDYHIQASRLFSELESADVIVKEVYRQLPVAQAYYDIDLDEYSKAIPHLRTAIERSGDNERKARYTYILAQLYQKNGQQQKAFATFQEASDYTNNYEMSFAGKLNVLRNEFASGEKSAEETLEELDKMLADGKNESYKDQIYFTKAEIALASDDPALAKEHLKSSLNSTQGSKFQRAESYYKLAELYYEDGSFVKAKNYYDSTLQAMATDDPRYDQTQKLSQNLEAIAKNLKTIEYQDSMLMLSRMSAEEREAIARRIIQKRQEKAEQKRKKQRQTALGGPRSVRGTPSAPTASSSSKPSSFFAYNQRALRKGINAFEDQWGDRPLRDNWRRSNRSNAGVVADSVQEAQTEEVITTAVPEEEMEEIFKDMPQTSQEINLTNKKIIEAYYQLGILYRNKIERYDYSADALETLNERFPQNFHLLDALYYLYLDYRDLGRESDAEQVKNRILNNFPDSRYARILNDPDYFKKREKDQKQIVTYYDNTYEQFNDGQYQSALRRIQQVDSLYVVPKEFERKFDLLKAMCYGNTAGKDSYIRALEKVIENHEDSKEAIHAKEILRFLKGDKAAFEEEVSLEEGQFLIQNDKLHYVIVILRNSDKVSLNDSKISISEYNEKNFNIKNLRISNIVLDIKKGTPLIIIRRFDDKTKSMDYYRNVNRHPKEFMPEDAVFDVYAINQRNYRQILKERSAAAYDVFFKKHYLKE